MPLSLRGLAGNHRIRRVDAKTGVIDTLAGNGTAGFSGSNVAGTSAMLKSPRKLLVAGGKLFFSDAGNYLVRAVLLEKVDAPPARPPSLKPPPLALGKPPPWLPGWQPRGMCTLLQAGCAQQPIRGLTIRIACYTRHLLPALLHLNSHPWRSAAPLQALAW